MAVVSGWSLVEAIFLPVVPDVALFLFALAAPRRALPLFLGVVVGSLIGTVVLVVLAGLDLGATERLVLAVPGVHQEMLSQTRDAFAAGNLLPFATVGPGTPLKVLSLAWLEVGGWPTALAAWVVVNRLTRIAPVLVLVVFAGLWRPEWLRRHDRLVLTIYGVIWLATYALYLA